MYIVFEGDNGVGKSTQLGRVKGMLEKAFNTSPLDDIKMRVNMFHEGDTVGGNYDNWYEKVLNYARDRAGLQSQINPIYSHYITLADRSYYSSIVYQGRDDKPSIEYIRMVNKFVIEPDLIILLAKDTESEIYNRYINTLPFGTTWIVNTSHYNIDGTTKEITRCILYKWINEYLNYDLETTWNIINDVLKEI